MCIRDRINIDQYGGVRGSSTNHYLAKLNDFVLNSLDSPKTQVIVTLVDMKKAFEFLDHLTLIEILLKYLVSPSDVLWIADFLKKRKQIVKFGQNLSSYEELWGH